MRRAGRWPWRGAGFFALATLQVGAFTPLLRPALPALAPFLLGLAFCGVVERPSAVAVAVAAAGALAVFAGAQALDLSGAMSDRVWSALLSLVASGAAAALIAADPTPRPDGSGLIVRMVEHLGRMSMAIILLHLAFDADRVRRLSRAGPACNPAAQLLHHPLRGWRGQASRQPGQIRKEAAATRPAWVAFQPLTLPPYSNSRAPRPLAMDCDEALI
jgi:hypothetical protein